MGKASRRKKDATPKAARGATYSARPFAGLPGESDWVALSEILPAATTTVPLKAGVAPDGGPSEVTIATVLPMAWPALRRGDGSILVATQGGSSSGDASRDLGAAILAALAAEPGQPVARVESATDATPPLQELLELTEAPVVTVHEGFDFWVEGQDLQGEAAESMQRANETVVPTTKMSGAESAYWCLLGDRPHIRLILPDDEDSATNAVARLWAAGASGLGEGTRMLGAFRARGLIIPVWELPRGTEAADYDQALTEFMSRYAAARTDAELTGEERRARAGLVNRQVTLR